MVSDGPHFVRPSGLNNYAKDVEIIHDIPPAPSTPASKWDWEKALLARGTAEGMTPGCQHIALLLAIYADGTGRNIRPTIATLIKVSGRSSSTVKSSLRWLRQSGWVQQVSRGQTGRASEYHLSIPE